MWEFWKKKPKKADLYEQVLESVDTTPRRKADFATGGRITTADVGVAQNALASRLARTNFNEFFQDRPGFGVFWGGILVGWAEQVDTNLEIRREMLDVTTSAMSQFIPGSMETTFRAENFHLLDDRAFHEAEVLHLILRLQDGTTYITEGFFTDLESGLGSTEEIITTARFRGNARMATI